MYVWCNKKVKKLEKSIFNKTLIVVEILLNWYPFPLNLNLHKLHWEFSWYMSVNITGDYRLVVSIDDYSNQICLFDIWTHSELYS
jgi:mRNA-degrading endonuclease YafQ of YafQ-DinJ toxin-antitoxin module